MLVLPPHPVQDLGDRAPETVETVGSKQKRWFRLPPENDRWIFKANRREVDGDDWAEVVAADLAASLVLPHATYHLALWRGQRGVLSRRFGSEDRRQVSGNEVLVSHARVPDYPVTDLRKRSVVPKYTPYLVLSALQRLDVRPHPSWVLPDNVSTGADVMVGYLLLDALIANTDRHDQNWAVEERQGGDIRQPPYYLSPTFDHASAALFLIPSAGRGSPLHRPRTTSPRFCPGLMHVSTAPKTTLSF